MSATCDIVALATDQRGFTLIEMIVVITIMGLVAGIVLIKQPWHSAGLNLDMTVQSLTNGLRLARSLAIAQDRTVRVDVGAHAFAVDGGAVTLLASEETLSPAQVIFTPDGGSTGGSIVIASGRDRVALDVNWLTGRVRARRLEQP